jgi:3-hydroxybutyrate dehydrogenase
MLMAKNEARTSNPAPRPLAGKAAVVTGSTSGIGLGIARRLAAEGAAVLINGLGNVAEIEKARSGLVAEFGVEVVYDNADMGRPDAVHAMVEHARHAFGKVDILVNNAGIQHVGPIETFPATQWDAILAINLGAAFHAIRACFADMKERGWGRIVNVASVHGLIASPYKSAYVAAKHGLVGLTKVVAMEGAEFGVTCNAICPGYVWTPLVEKQIDDQAQSHGIPREKVVRELLLKQQPTKRFATVEEVAALAAFLCGPDAASITGSALPVDGGWIAH